MTPEALVLEPAWRIARHIAAGEVSATDVVAASLARIERYEPQVHAFVTVTAEQALEEAAAADLAVKSGKPLASLHGVPIAVKDELWTQGVRATAGSLAYENYVPDSDGTCMARLRAAGAILVGKTNVPEFMCWSRTANRLGPETVNPWDARRSPGASSGGSAAAVAAGMVPLAIGSDGGGSIRIPAAACGIAGFYPTPGRVPDTGSFSYSPLASLGPIARDVRDLAIAMQVMAGPDGMDPRAVPPLDEWLPAIEQGVSGMVLGWSADFGHITTQPGLPELVRSSLNCLAAAGARIEEAGLVFDDFWPLLMSAGGVFAELDPGTSQPFTQSPVFLEHCRAPENFSRLTEIGQAAVAERPGPSLEEREQAIKAIHALRDQVEALFDEYDAIVTPTLPVIAPLLPSGMDDPYPHPPVCCGTYFTAIANLCRLPAATVPCGFLDGMPVGLQIIGRHGHDQQVLAICRSFEWIAPQHFRCAPMDGDQG